MLDLIASLLGAGIVHSQYRDRGELRDRLEAGHARASGHRAEIAGLSRKVDELTLLGTALWELLQARAPVTDDELAERIREIDLRDGVLDGRIAKPGEPPRCPDCRRVASKTLSRCMYCGTEVRHEQEKRRTE